MISFFFFRPNRISEWSGVRFDVCCVKRNKSAYFRVFSIYLSLLFSPSFYQGADLQTEAEDPIVLRALDRDRACIVVIVIVIVIDRATAMSGGFTVFISIVC